MKKLAVLTLALASAACADDLRDGKPTPSPTPSPSNNADPHFTHKDVGRGLTETVVDARDMMTWIHWDIDANKEVEATDPKWDLAFRRFAIQLNGGVSGGGGVDLAVDEVGGIEGLTQAPAGPWSTDAVDGDDEDTEPDLAFLAANEGWYDYEITTHTLTAKDRVYFVRSTEGQAFKLQILDYYDAARTPGWMKFLWGTVEKGPELPADARTVDLNSGVVYLQLDGTTVTANDPWDVALDRINWRTNSGASGTALGGARIATGRYDAITAAATHGYRVDALVEIEGSAAQPMSEVLSDWYVYNISTHTVTPKPQSYWVRGARGDYGKLDVLAYAEGKSTFRLAPVERRAEVVELDVDATTTAFVSLRAGGVVTVTTASTSDAWDLRFDAETITTNSGVSGGGSGGAIDAGATAFDAITGTPAGTVVEDTLLPLPGPPGSGEAPGNAALATWYDYDMATHVVSPRSKAFIIRTADGGWAKLQITAYTNHVYHLRTLYAGAGQSAL